MDGNIMLKEHTHSINNKTKLYILGVLSICHEGVNERSVGTVLQRQVLTVTCGDHVLQAGPNSGGTMSQLE